MPTKRPTRAPVEAIIDRLIAGLPLGGTFADVRFFAPNAEFFLAMRDFIGRAIYDVGCGCGHVTEALHHQSHDVIGIDLHYRPSQPKALVVIRNAIDVRYRPNGVVLICRPSHGYFTEAVVRRARECGVQNILYAGLANNVRADLGRYRSDFKRIRVKVGDDGEHLYSQVRGRA